MINPKEYRWGDIRICKSIIQVFFFLHVKKGLQVKDDVNAIKHKRLHK